MITVPAETEASRPTVVTVTGHGRTARYGHLLVQAEPFSRAVVVLDHRGSATYADNVELVVGDGASLSVVSLQDWADDAVHLTHHYATLGRDARLRHTAVTLGGSVVRLAPSVRYDGPGGDAELTGLYFADAGQHLEHRLFVDHDVPRCRSRVTYKGALQGAGRARGLDRRRADQAGGHRHRHLRVQQEPGADRRHPGRFGAEPGDPHRGDRRGRARQRQRQARRPSPVLPDGPRHPVRRGPQAGHPRVLRPADRHHRGTRAAGPDHRGDRGGADEVATPEVR